MQITEVRIKLMEEAGERLQAFCSITFDDSFVIRDLKIIEGINGPFVAMPSRKLTSHCPGCGCKNHLRAAYCSQCGSKLKNDRAVKDEDGRAKLYADIAHPINSACREMIQDRVIREFYDELDRAKLPGYVSRYDDIDVDDMTIHTHASHGESSPPAPHRSPAPAGPAREAGRREPTQRSNSGGGGTNFVQPAEQHPRGPHRLPPAPAGANTPGSATAAGPAPAPKSLQHATAPQGSKAASSLAASQPNESASANPGKSDSFGAGIL